MADRQHYTLFHWTSAVFEHLTQRVKWQTWKYQLNGRTSCDKYSHEFPTALLVLVVDFIMGDDDEWKKLAIEDKVVHKVNVFFPKRLALTG